ncbi:MAG: lyase family protein [Frisingicoccus sp.]
MNEVELLVKVVELDIGPFVWVISERKYIVAVPNDQVLLDLKLFTRTQIKEVAEAVEQVFHVLIRQSERYKNVLMPGYTHLQKLQCLLTLACGLVPTPRVLWTICCFCRRRLKCEMVNPLGSAAGYGSVFSC